MPDPEERRYTIEEARALIPELRAVVLQLAVEQRRLSDAHAQLHALLVALPPPPADDVAEAEANVEALRAGIATLLDHLTGLGVVLRDLDLGLLDLPGERDGEPVWLCWRLADPELAWWHRRDEGYAARRPW